MIESFNLPLSVAVSVVVAGVCYRRGVSLFRLALAVVFAVYLVFLLGATFFPLPVDSGYIADSRENQFLSNNFELLATLRESLSNGFSGFLRNIVGNLVLLTPFAALMPVFNKKLRTLPRVLTATFLVSLLIEMAQLAVSEVYGFTYKVFDIDDIWLNTLGAMLGYFAYLVVTRSVLSLSPPETGPKVAKGVPAA